MITSISTIINRNVVRLGKFEMGNAKYVFALLSMASLLFGCGGTKTVITADDSAEYRHAISLPPLKKPEAKTSGARSYGETEVAQDARQESEAKNEKESFSSARSINVDADQQASVVAVKPKSIIQSKVIELDENRARLSVEESLESAWEFVSQNLRKSDITVHSRNKKAGSFAIGCSQDGEQLNKPVKKGRWSFFTRKQKATEHCRLLLSGEGKATHARLLYRNGGEFSVEDSKALYARLLNN